MKHENIGIRAIEKSDLLQLQQWRNSENLRRYFREYRDFSISQKEKWYENMIFDKNFEMFMIIDLENNNTPIGATGFTYIDWLNRHCDLHFYIGLDDMWIDNKFSPSAIDLMLKRGFHFMNMNKIWAEVYEMDNKKLDFFKNKGFSIDACLRRHYYYDGRYYDSYILSILKEEYEKGISNSSSS